MLGIVDVDHVHRTQAAASAMVVGEHFYGVVDSPSTSSGSHDVRHHAVFEHYVQQRVIFSVLIIEKAEKAFVLEGRQPGDAMRAGRTPPPAGSACQLRARPLPLQVQDGARDLLGEVDYLGLVSKAAPGRLYWRDVIVNTVRPHDVY